VGCAVRSAVMTRSIQGEKQRIHLEPSQKRVAAPPCSNSDVKTCRSSWH
jgi:hypothetical protein